MAHRRRDGELGCCREQFNAVPNEHGRDSDMGSPLEAAMAAALTRRTSSGDACVAEQRDDLVQASPLLMCPAVLAGSGCCVSTDHATAAVSDGY